MRIEIYWFHVLTVVATLVDTGFSLRVLARLLPFVLDRYIKKRLVFQMLVGFYCVLISTILDMTILDVAMLQAWLGLGLYLYRSKALALLETVSFLIMI
jgi:hypothetical protein